MDRNVSWLAAWRRSILMQRRTLSRSSRKHSRKGPAQRGSSIGHCPGDHRCSGPVLAILCFHKIGEPPEDGWDTWFYISKNTFVEQLRWLRDQDWRVIDAATFLRGLSEPEVLPPRAALLTFDDGCQQFLEVAFPCL